MFVPHFAGGHAAPGRSRPKPHQHDLFATRAASMSKLCQPRAPHLTASFREQPVQASVPPRHLCLRCFRPARSYAQGHTYWNRVTATSVRVCWSCPLSVAPQLCRGADPSRKNQTCSLRDASMLYICQPRAPHFTSTAPRAASASLGIASAPFFFVLPPARNCAPGHAYWNRDEVISDQESPFRCFDEGSVGPRANLRKESGRSSRDITGTTGAGPSGLIASDPGVRAWATPFCPFRAKTGGSRWDFCRDYFFPVRAYRQSIWVSLKASFFLVLLHRSE